MSRPADLAYTVPTWATDSTFLSGSFLGQPTKVAPPAPNQGFLPGTPCGVEYMNYIFNAWSVGMAADKAGAQGAINAVGQLPALNWKAPITPPSYAAVGRNPAVFSDTEQCWYVCNSANAATIYKSFDAGSSWVTAATAIASEASDIAFDTAGNAVIVHAAFADIQEGPFISYGTAITFTKRTGAITAGSGSNAASVVYEPVNGKWCILNSLAGTNIKAFTSTDRATWTARTPFNTTTAGAMNTQLGVGNGVLIAAYAKSASLLRVSRSADGGVTWTNEQDLAIDAAISMSIVAGEMPFSKPVYSVADGAWYIAVNQFSPTRKCQLWSSPDGITWTAVVSMLNKDVCLTQLACLGTLMVALSSYNPVTASNQDGRLYVSVNRGASWYRAGRATDAQALSLRAGGGGLAIVTGLNAIACSQRFGLPTQQV